MRSLTHPKLRPLPGGRVRYEGQWFVAFDDPLGLVPSSMLVPMELFSWVIRRFDGETSLKDIQNDVQEESGQALPLSFFENIARQLEDAMALEGPKFAGFRESYRQEPIRRSKLAGSSYPADRETLERWLDSFNRDATATATATTAASIRGAICPHIDFRRGGAVYASCHKELAERCDADTIVILGVSHKHHCAHRFAATRKSFETPLGLVETDQRFLDLMESKFGDRLFADEVAHIPEWSIEFQAVFLRHALNQGRRNRPFRIVPILVSSFQDLMEAGADPIEDPEVRDFLNALRRAEADCGRSVAYLASVDFAHVGREFGDPHLLEPDFLNRVRTFDAGLIDRARANDPKGWFRQAAEVEDRYRVCGLAATYALLHAVGDAPGRLIRYEQAVNRERTCCVSIAGMIFERPD